MIDQNLGTLFLWRTDAGKEWRAVKVTVKEGCISCGLCTEEHPDLFHLNDEGIAEGVGQVPAGQEDQARQAAEDCPVGVIQTEA